jgi:1-acyl-sn-glycerol-3-phosphate acyltransferase
MIRSALFNLAFYVWTVIMVVGFAPALLLPWRATVWGQRQWARGVNWLMRVTAGIDVEIRGRENLPAGGCIVASKHQSAWDTLIWHAVLDDPAVVLKKELLLIPIYGLMCMKTRMIPVDRKAGAKALKSMARLGQAAAAAGRPIVIFPQGTRTAPGLPYAERPYQPGISALYRALDVPVVPVALNSGLFWPRRTFMRNPGTIVLEFLPAIEPGLKRRDFEDELRQRIETATARLEAEAGFTGADSA